MDFEFSTQRYLAEPIRLYGWEIGDHTHGNPIVMEKGRGHLEIGRYCSIGHGATIILANPSTELTSTYPFRSLYGNWPSAQFGLPDYSCRGAVRIGHDVWLGPHCMILSGVVIGNGAIVMPGAVVCDEVPDYAVVAGNPAQIIRYRFDASIVQRLQKIAWWDWTSAKLSDYMPSISGLGVSDFCTIVEKNNNINDILSNLDIQEVERSYMLWGRADIKSGKPEIEQYREALYVPFSADNNWGLYDSNGDIISNSVDYRGPEKHLNNQIDSSIKVSDFSDFPRLDSQKEYIYCGRMNPHFGHFLINSLPRLWAIKNFHSKNFKILCHIQAPIEEYFKIDFFKTILGALDLSAEDFVVTRSPLWIDHITLPNTALMEQSYGYECYRDFCLSIFKEIIGDNFVKSDKPIYYSKENLKSGVGNIINESDISNIMESAGFQVIFPERLSFANQLKIIAEAPFIAGTAGSFLHNIIFIPNPPKVAVINPSREINSNFEIIDKLSGCEVDYIYSSKILVKNDSSSSFLTSRVIENPEDVSKLLIEIFNSH